MSTRKWCRFPPRRYVLAYAAGAVVLALTAGCGADPTLDASNRGSGSHTGDTSVENAYIVPRAVPGACSLQVGDRAELRFTLTNNRPTETEYLLAIATDAFDTVRMAPTRIAVQAQARTAVGEPATQRIGATEQHKAVELAGLTAEIRPGTSIDMTFTFELAGPIRVNAPIEACPTQQ